MLKVYLCAFKNRAYIEEAKVCVESLRTKGHFTGPIYVFTDMDVSIDSVSVIKATCETVQLSAAYKTRLFEHIPDFSRDDIFLYLDTDIVILKPLPSFTSINHKIHVYGYPDRTQEHYSFAGFLTNNIKYTSISAISTGILVFRPSSQVKTVFDKTYAMYVDLLKKNKVNGCWEQPALCFTMIEEDMYDISLNECVYEERSNSAIKESHVFNHFCGMRGSSRHVLMKKYLL